MKNLIDRINPIAVFGCFFSIVMAFAEPEYCGFYLIAMWYFLMKIIEE